MMYGQASSDHVKCYHLATGYGTHERINFDRSGDDHGANVPPSGHGAIKSDDKRKHLIIMQVFLPMKCLNHYT